MKISDERIAQMRAGWTKISDERIAQMRAGCSPRPWAALGDLFIAIDERNARIAELEQQLVELVSAEDYRRAKHVEQIKTLENALDIRTAEGNDLRHTLRKFESLRTFVWNRFSRYSDETALHTKEGTTERTRAAAAMNAFNEVLTNWPPTAGDYAPTKAVLSEDAPPITAEDWRMSIKYHTTHPDGCHPDVARSLAWLTDQMVELRSVMESLHDHQARPYDDIKDELARRIGHTTVPLDPDWVGYTQRLVANLLAED